MGPPRPPSRLWGLLLLAVTVLCRDVCVLLAAAEPASVATGPEAEAVRAILTDPRYTSALERSHRDIEHFERNYGRVQRQHCPSFEQLATQGDNDGARWDPVAPTDAPDSSVLHWTDDAEQLVLRRLAALQFPEDCSKAKWLFVRLPAAAGLFHNMHVFSLQLLFGLFTGRTVIPLKDIDISFDDDEKNKAAPEAYHLAHYIDNITSCKVNDNGTMINGIPLDIVATRQPRALRLLRAFGFSDMKRVYFTNDTAVARGFQRLRNAKHQGLFLTEQATKQHTIFWKNIGLLAANRTVWGPLWDELVAINAVQFMVPQEAKSTQDIDETWEGSEDTNATPPIDLQRSFMLHSFVTKYIFTPTRIVMEYANNLLSVSDTEHPLAVVHRRQTDSYSEDSYFLTHRKWMPASRFLDAIVKRQAMMGVPFKTIVLLSDSLSAVRELEDEARKRVPQAKLVVHMPEKELSEAENTVAKDDAKDFFLPTAGWTRNEVGFEKMMNHQREERGGTKYVVGHAVLPERVKLQSFLHFAGALFASARAADYAVVNFRSSVGRTLVEMIGAQQCLAQITRSGALARSLDIEYRL